MLKKLSRRSALVWVRLIMLIAIFAGIAVYVVDTLQTSLGSSNADVNTSFTNGIAGIKNTTVLLGVLGIVVIAGIVVEVVSGRQGFGGAM